jgi:hypothetical protein
LDEKEIPKLPNDDKAMIILEIPELCMGSHLIPGRLDTGYVVQKWYIIGGILQVVPRCYSVHTSLSERLLVHMDLLNPSLRMKLR